MAKWVSPILTDIRNKLGNSVIFSNWKGRAYFRKYARPANPRTNKQIAQRETFKKLVKRFQEIEVNASEKEAWDNKATPYMMSGFNLFMSRGRKSYIEASSDTANVNGSVTITYSIGFPVDEATIVIYKDGSYYGEQQISTASGSFTYTFSEAGTYEFWIAEKDIQDPNGHPSRITKWKPDPNIPGAKECKVTVS